MGQIRGSQLALEHMRRDKGGRGGVIVNTVSMAGQDPSLYRDHYHRHYRHPPSLSSCSSLLSSLDGSH